MRRITVTAPVMLSPEVAEQALEKYIHNHGDEHGTFIETLVAHVPQKSPNDLSLAHDVVVHVRNGRDASGLNDTLLVEWEPVGEGTYPHFKGVLNVLGSSDPNQSCLEIDGTYEVPGDGIGELFDSLVGSRIAEASLSDLARRLAGEIHTG